MTVGRRAARWRSGLVAAVLLAGVLAPAAPASAAAAVTVLRAWPGVDGIGLAWESPRALGGQVYDVDRTTDGGATWTRLSAPAGVPGTEFADVGAPTGSAYRVTPRMTGEAPDPSQAAQTGSLDPLAAWSPPAGARTVVAVDGWTPDRGVTARRTSLTALADGFESGLAVTTDADGWRPGSFTAADGWHVVRTSAGIAQWDVDATVRVTRAVRRADGTPVELALAVTGSAVTPMAALVVVDSVPDGLPGRFVADPEGGPQWLSAGLDRSWPVSLRNVGGTAASTGVPGVDPYPAADPGTARVQWRVSGCSRVVVPAGGTCTALVRGTQSAASLPFAVVHWTDAGTQVAAHLALAYTPPPDQQPVVTAAGPSGPVRGRAVVTFTASDPQDGGAAVRCTLDGGLPQACSSPWTTPALVHGTHQVQVFAVDDDGYPSDAASLVVTSDLAGPVARVLGPDPEQPVLTGRALVRWTATDSPAGVGRYSVSVRTATSRTGFGGWAPVPGLGGTTAEALSAALPDGAERCWSVRATDTVGNPGAWSAGRCAVAPVDDLRLAASGSVARQPTIPGAAFHRTLSVLQRPGSALSYPAAGARQVGLLLFGCCGTVDVYLGGSRLGRVRGSSVRGARQVVWLPRGAAVRTGTLRVVSRSAEPFLLDGVVLRRS